MERGCTVLLIPSVSNTTVDKQKGLQERQGREGIIRVLERKRGTVSPAVESVSHATGIKRARPTITKAARGNKSQLFPLMLPSTVKRVLLQEKKTEERPEVQFKTLYYRPGGVRKSVCASVHACGYGLRAGLVCEAWNEASSDVTRRRRWWWWWCGQFLRGIKSTRRPDLILHLRPGVGPRARVRSTRTTQPLHSHVAALNGYAPALGLASKLSQSSPKLRQLFLIA